MTIPKAHLIRRIPLKSASDGSYSPYTHYFEFNHQNFPEWVQKSKNLKNEKLSHLYEVESVIQHELAHWIQSHGTSVGVLQSALRSIQTHLFLQTPGNFGWMLTNDLVTRRFGRENMPLIVVEGSDLISDPLEKELPEFALYRRNWFDLQLTQQLFYQPKKLLKSKHNLSEAFFRSLVLTNLFKDSKSSDEDFHFSEKYDVSPDEENLLRNEIGGNIDVFSLLEGFATVNQCLYYTLYQHIEKTPWLEARIALIIKAIAETRYGNAIRYFVGACTKAKEDIIKGLAAFCAIVDLSLHPKLEQLDMDYLQSHNTDAFFSEIYPPARFMKLCEACNQIPLISLNSGHDAILQYQGELLRRAGLKVSKKYLAGKKRLKSVDSLSFNADTLKKYTISDVEIYWQDAAVKARKLHPALYTLPSPQFIYGREWLINLRRDPYLKNVLQPPLWSDRKSHIYFGISEKPCHCLIFWSVVSSAIYDINCGRGKIDLSMFPEDVVGSGIAEDALGAVFRHLGFETAFA